jgi:hypothetical protein
MHAREPKTQHRGGRFLAGPQVVDSACIKRRFLSTVELATQ